MGKISEDFTYNEPTTDRYTPTATDPTKLTDPPAAYAVPSEAAMEVVKNLIYSGIDGGLGELVIYGGLSVAYSTLEEAEAAENDLHLIFARALDQFAALQVEAALNHAQYLHILESDDKADKAVEAREAEIAEAVEGLWVEGYAPGTLSAILAIVNKPKQ